MLGDWYDASGSLYRHCLICLARQVVRFFEFACGESCTDSFLIKNMFGRALWELEPES